MDEIELLINEARNKMSEKTPTRELAIAITKLDEAALWYGVEKAMVKLQKNPTTTINGEKT